MDDFQAIAVLNDATKGLVQTIERRKGDEILQGLKTKQIDPDSLGNRPYEKQALDAWHESDTAKYIEKYSGMSFDEIQNVNPYDEDNQMHAAKAYNEVMKTLGSNEKVKAATTAIQMNNAMEKYGLFEAKRIQMNRYIASGENDLAGQLAADLISNSTMPLRATYDPKTGRVKTSRKNISPDDMGSPLTPEGDVPLSEISKTINNIGPKDYAIAHAVMAQAATKANQDSPLKQYYNPETRKSIFARSLVNMKDMSQSYLEAYNAKGEAIPVPNEGALVGMGYQPVDAAGKELDLKKAETEIGLRAAQTVKTYAEADYIHSGKQKGPTPKAIKDDMKATILNTFGPQYQVWDAEDEAKNSENMIKELETAKKNTPVGEEFNAAAAIKAYNERVYGVPDPLTEEPNPNIEWLIDDKTGFEGRLYKKTGKITIDKYPLPLQRDASSATKQPSRRGLEFTGKPGNEKNLNATIEVNGKRVVVPLLVPTLTQDQKDFLIAGGKPTDDIMKKALEHAGVNGGGAGSSKEEKEKVSGIAQSLKGTAKKEKAEDTYMAADGGKFKVSQMKNPVLKDGVLWAEVNGRTVRVDRKPSEKAYSYGHLAPNPEYKNYMDLLKKLGLK